MIAILKMRGNPGEPIVMVGSEEIPDIAPEISGWILAPDVQDARRQAESIGEHHLAQWLYSMEFPSKGRHELLAGRVGESRYVMLVS